MFQKNFTDKTIGFLMSGSIRKTLYFIESDITLKKIYESIDRLIALCSPKRKTI